VTSNHDSVEQVARELIDHHGPDALRIVRERAEIAGQLGDQLSAKAWRDIADTIERLLANDQAFAAKA